MQRGFSRQRGAQPQEGHRGQADYLLQLWQAQGSAGLPKFTRSYWHSAAALSHYQISRELSGLRINSSVSCFKISVKPEPETELNLFVIIIHEVGLGVNAGSTFYKWNQQYTTQSFQKVLDKTGVDKYICFMFIHATVWVYFWNQSTGRCLVFHWKESKSCLVLNK